MKDLIDDSFDVLAQDEFFYPKEIVKAKQILNEIININVPIHPYLIYNYTLYIAHLDE